MKRLVLFLCLQGIAFALLGQSDYLQLTRGKYQQHIRKIPEGKMVYVKPIISDRKGIFIGKLEILNDSAITTGKDTILVNNIKKIRVRNTASYVMGSVVIAASLGIAIYGIYIVSEMLPLSPDPYLAFFEMIGIMFGMAVIGGGIIYVPVGILIMAYGNGYRTHGRHAYSIKVAHDQTIIPSTDNLARLRHIDGLYHYQK